MCERAYKIQNMCILYLVTYKLRFNKSTDYTLSILDPVYYLLYYTLLRFKGTQQEKKKKTKQKNKIEQRLKLKIECNEGNNTQHIKHRYMVDSAAEHQSRQQFRKFM